MILVAYRHGLRVSELIGLTWRQIDLDAARLRVIRAKGSENGVHPLSGREIQSLRSLRRRQVVGTPWVFVTSRRGKMTRNGFYKLLEKAATRAGIDDVHPHLLRHGCGFKLVNQGMDTLSLAAHLDMPTCKTLSDMRGRTQRDLVGCGGIEHGSRRRWRDLISPSDMPNPQHKRMRHCDVDILSLSLSLVTKSGWLR